MNTHQRVLNHLKSGHYLSRGDAWRLFSTMSLLSIINVLRETNEINDVWIRNEKTGKRFKRYFIGRKF